MINIAILVEEVYSKELQKANGDVFCEIRRSPDNAFIFVNWVGIQSLETIVMGYNHVLYMLRTKTCPAILNNNHELIGPWDMAVNWLVHKWIPQAKALGIMYYAHILSHGIFGRRSFEQLKPALKLDFNTESFEDEALAEEWIYLKL